MRIKESESPADAARTIERPVTLNLAGPREVLRLQRTVGNRAVGRLLRAPRELQRPMQHEKGGKADEPWRGPDGSDWVWDAFDRTLTIFTPIDGPQGGRAIQVTYRDKQWSDEELKTAKPEDFYSSVEVLSPLRAKALEWLRTQQGTFQETEAHRAKRVQDVLDSGSAHTTMCNVHTGDFASHVAGAIHHMNFMDLRQGAIDEKRAGAFHTLWSHPAGPKPGDIYSLGAVNKASKKGALRSANFLTTMHVGVFKSRRPGPGGTEIWTVVDGGQGTFEGRQETRERTRVFQRERLMVRIPKLGSTGKLKGWESDLVELECGVLSSKLADAGQADDDKLLRGWIDLDEMFGGGEAPAATPEGAQIQVFAGRPAPVPA
jgi:hypothetical protein